MLISLIKEDYHVNKAKYHKMKYLPRIDCLPFSMRPSGLKLPLFLNLKLFLIRTEGSSISFIKIRKTAKPEAFYALKYSTDVLKQRKEIM